MEVFTSPNDYLASILRGIYRSRRDFWVVKPKAAICWAWRSLLHGRDLLEREGRWIVGNGTNIDIMEDKWLSNDSAVEVTEECTTTRVSDMMDHNSKCWNITELRKFLSPNSAIEVMKTPMGGQTVITVSCGLTLVMVITQSNQDIGA